MHIKEKLSSEKGKRILLMIGILGFSVILGVMTEVNKRDKDTLNSMYGIQRSSESVFSQDVISQLSNPYVATQLYHKNQLVGIITDESQINAYLNDIYTADFEAHFPNSQLNYSDDIYTVEHKSYNVYENIDQQIVGYLSENNLLSIKANKIEFSNGAVIYCKNLEDFENARNTFISGYVSGEELSILASGETVPNLNDYGTKTVGFEVLESLVFSEGYAPLDDIKTNEKEILNFLSFGYDFESKSYTVEEFDTIEGIAWLNQMSSQQLLSINSDQLKSINQVLKPGTQLEVTRINSPLTVRVTQQRLTSETLYPESTLYIEDPSLREGLTRVSQAGKLGSEDVLYEDVYENDIAVSSKRLSSKTTVEPVREVIYVGTYVEPRVGTGNFRMPMINSKISCGWGCYAGHQGIDIQSRSNRGYGPIYASDRGVVETNTYQSGYGYYVVINHNNGYKTLYAHLDSPGYFRVGQTVLQGEQIGYVGMTGITTGPHLHFEIIVNGVRRNPCGYLSC